MRNIRRLKKYVKLYFGAEIVSFIVMVTSYFILMMSKRFVCNELGENAKGVI